MPEITLILHNIRSTHNVGSIFRTAEGFGVKEIILSGYTPYPQLPSELQRFQKPSRTINNPVKVEPSHGRLPHIAEKLTSQIHKTALGAEKLVPFTHVENIMEWLEQSTIPLVALEQASDSVPLPEFTPPAKFALLLGEEVHGIIPELLHQADHIIEIPMFGQKESFNVSVAAGIALYGMLLEQSFR